MDSIHAKLEIVNFVFRRLASCPNILPRAMLGRNSKLRSQKDQPLLTMLSAAQLLCFGGEE